MGKRIDWSKKWDLLFESLKEHTVRETAEILDVSYATLCKYLASLSMDSEGKFKSRLKHTENLREVVDYLIKKYGQSSLIQEATGMSKSQLSSCVSDYKLRPKWDLENSTSPLARVGRKAEVFVASLPDFRVLKDAGKYDTTSPYDLILMDYGSVDVKSTKLRDSESPRWKFDVSSNIGKYARQVKYYFLVGYDENYENPQALFILPSKLVKGKHSISISKKCLEKSKYLPYLYKKFENF